jgi:hypothetical protein
VVFLASRQVLGGVLAWVIITPVVVCWASAVLVSMDGVSVWALVSASIPMKEDLVGMIFVLLR